MLTTREVAEELNLSKERILQLRKTYGLGRNWGGLWLFTRHDVRVMQRRNTQRGRPKQENNK